jgi:catechol 2,3-dioxygenase-like lactoylglutathione lyase family enzyme
VIRGIHHIAMHTPNFDAMAKFYRGAFGFEPVAPDFRWGPNAEMDGRMGVAAAAARTMMLRANNCYLELFEYSSPPPRAAGAALPSDHGYTHFAVEVKDIAAEAERLAALGMSFSMPLPIDFSVYKFVYGRDPDGNVIELLEHVEGGDPSLEELGVVS